MDKIEINLYGKNDTNTCTLVKDALYCVRKILDQPPYFSLPISATSLAK